MKTMNKEYKSGLSVDVPKGVDTPTGALVFGTAIEETTVLTVENFTASFTVNFALETSFDKVKVVGVVAAGMGRSDHFN